MIRYFVTVIKKDEIFIMILFNSDLMRILLISLIAFLIIGCAEEAPVKNYVTDTANLNPKIAVFKDENDWKAQVTFILPNPCHKIEYDGKVVSEKEILLKYKHTPPEPGVNCIQVIEIYNETIRIGELSKGEYNIIIQVNGKERREINFVV